MVETKIAQSRARADLARIDRQRRTALRQREWAELDVSIQAESPKGFSLSDENKRLALSYIKTRAAEMLLDFDLHPVSLDDLHLYQPLNAIRGTGLFLSPRTRRWVRDVVDFSEEIFAPQSSWVVLKTERIGKDEQCFVVEATEHGLDDWIRFRRSSRTHHQGVHTALPFLLYEESRKTSGSRNAEYLARLSRALVRRG